MYEHVLNFSTSRVTPAGGPAQMSKAVMVQYRRRGSPADKTVTSQEMFYM